MAQQNLFFLLLVFAMSCSPKDGGGGSENKSNSDPGEEDAIVSAEGGDEDKEEQASDDDAKDEEETTEEESDPITLSFAFPESLGEITLDTDKVDIDQLLGSGTLDEPSGITLYDNNNIAIAFNDETPAKPVFLMVVNGYQGKLNFPKPIGEVSLGDDLGQFFPEDDRAGVKLMRDFGRILDGKIDDPNYDCRRVNSCGASVVNNNYVLTFDKGSFIIGPGNSDFLIAADFVVPPPARTAPLALDVDFQANTVGGFSMQTVNADIEAIFGAERAKRPSTGSKFFSYYDNENIVIEWSGEDPNIPAIIEIEWGYDGRINFPARFTEPVKMGQSFAAEFPETDTEGAAFMKELARFFLGQAEETYDCTTVEPATCKFEMNDSYLFFHYEKGSVIFSNNDDKTLFAIQFFENDLAAIGSTTFSLTGKGKNSRFLKEPRQLSQSR